MRSLRAIAAVIVAVLGANLVVLAAGAAVQPDDSVAAAAIALASTAEPVVEVDVDPV